MDGENSDGNTEETEVEIEIIEPVEPVPEEPLFDSLQKFCDTKDPDGEGKCKIQLTKLLNGDITPDKFKEKTQKLIDSPEEQNSVDYLLGNLKSQFRLKEE